MHQCIILYDNKRSHEVVRVASTVDAMVAVGAKELPKTSRTARFGRFIAPITLLVALAAVVNLTHGQRTMKEALKSKPFDPRRPVCQQNPYVGALDESLEEISSRMDSWLGNIDAHHVTADAADMKIHNHARFFPFEAMATCKTTSCVGGPCRADRSKIVCGLDQLGRETKTDNNCVIYSIGGKNHWEFEMDLLRKTPCQVHTFDCTGRIERFRKPPNSRLHFHHVCLGTKHEDALPDGQCKPKEEKKCGETWTLLEMQQRLGHKRIDLFKMDIEGFEWPLLESWPEVADHVADDIVLPMQILVEVHYETLFEELHPPGNNGKPEFKFGRDMVNLQAHLLRMGYVVVERDDNKFCPHCTELTLVQSRCPDAGKS